MDGYFAELCAANAVYLRERLLNGVLVRRGLADRAAIVRRGTSAASKLEAYPFEFAHALSVACGAGGIAASGSHLSEDIGATTPVASMTR